MRVLICNKRWRETRQKLLNNSCMDKSKLKFALPELNLREVRCRDADDSGCASHPHRDPGQGR